MVSLLVKLFIKNKDDVYDPNVRRGYGMISGIVGIFLNVVLFAFKYLAGSISGSIAIISDAFNNLSDAGSSVVTLLGFKMSGAKPDDEHPYGHGRMEYISGFIVSVIIIVMGIELGRSGVEKIISPEPIETDALTVIILIAAIIVKLYMFFYNNKLGKKINSTGMRATAMDSISDVVATSVVLISTMVMKLANINIDGWCGAAVSLFIIYAGFGAAKDTLYLLLGKAPEKEMVEEIREIVLSHEEIIGIHDLMVHDYGPGRVMISLHGEVPGNGNLLHLHDVIDRAERELKEKLRCEAVIHMDPIDVDDEKVMEMLEHIGTLVKTINENITIHDLRLVTGPTHTNIIFDAVIPRGFDMPEKEIKKEIERLVSDNYENSFAVVNLDKSYI